MAIIRAMVVVPADNQLPRDSVVNNWHFSTTGTGTDVTDAITVALDTFYTPLLNYLSSLYVWLGARVKFYALEDPPPRAPIADNIIGLSEAGAGTNLPQEVALCLSFKGATASGASMARRRGRVYLGPWAVTANNGATGRPAGALLTQVAACGDTLLSDSASSALYQWVVLSTASGSNVATDVVEGWVDDAWDTQRRRGNGPLSRLQFA